MTKKEITINIDQKMIVALALVVLVMVAGVQAFQLNSLKSKLSSGELSLSSSTSSSSVSTASGGGNTKPAVPASIQDLPSMVGGC